MPKEIWLSEVLPEGRGLTVATEKKAWERQNRAELGPKGLHPREG